MLTDIEIAQRANIKPIKEIAEGLSIDEDDLNYYGKYKAKLSESLFKKLKSKKDGKLILVTAINPTPAGEGKTTITIGLGQAMSKLGKKAIVALREPSLGPVFGLKGGATGGGYSQVIPMEDINLHFTGDMHSVTAANNLLCAMLDNHLQQGNKLNIDVKQILVRRCLDINDRALRNIVIGLGGKMNAVPREDSFIITVASEVMAILCLAKDLKDLKEKLGNILIAYSTNNEPIFAKDIKANGAMAALLKDAINPNLVQTLDGTPAIIHGGPFANIAHGCNSIRATKLSLKLADYCITEAGFGSDLGAEKFFDIKCRLANLKPTASVLVATVRALKYNGGIDKNELHFKNLKALKLGIKNLSRHIDILKRFNVPIIVAINKFDTDTKDELKFIEDFCREKNVSCSIANAYSGGADGCIDLANKLFKVVEKNKLKFSPLYPLEKTIKEKIEIICKKIYGAKNVIYTPEAYKAIEKINSLNGDNLPICIAKTQYSFSDDQTLLGAPTDFYITIRDAKISNGAGFVVVYTGNIMTMPGLPKTPAANDIDISLDGKVTGLF